MNGDYAERDTLRLADRWVRNAHLPDDVCWLAQSRLAFTSLVARGTLDPAPAQLDRADPAQLTLIYMIGVVKATHPEAEVGAWVNRQGAAVLSIILPTAVVLICHRDDHGPVRAVPS